jgi:ceramide glucosyltransferase
MLLRLTQILTAIAALCAFCGMGYYLLCLWSARVFIRDHSRETSSKFTPPISILKPLRGTDPEIYEAFRSHCLQDYPEYEIIFGVSDPKDDAIKLVHQLQNEFPERAINLIVAENLLGTNGKVSTLLQMVPESRFEHLIVNDSDIRVEPDYLRRVIAPFADQKVGMVTCLYRGIAGNTLGSKLEAIGISTDFSAGVLAARVLEGVRFGLGSTLAFTRDSLEKIGGFEPLVDYLADDFELGRRISNLGKEVVISDVVVDHHLPNYTFRQFFDHQMRWARSVRDSRKWGYAGVVLTFGVPWAIAAVVFSGGNPWTWALLGLAFLLRIAMALTVGRFILRDRQVVRDLWLIPVRDVVAIVFWAASFAGHTVLWRGDVFVLEDGKLRPAQGDVV